MLVSEPLPAAASNVEVADNAHADVAIEGTELTLTHRALGMTLIPSTTRIVFVSVKHVSGTKTEQRMCAQPWPSVGLHARRNESGGGPRIFCFPSLRGRGQRRQTGF